MRYKSAKSASALFVIFRVMGCSNKCLKWNGFSVILACWAKWTKCDFKVQVRSLFLIGCLGVLAILLKFKENKRYFEMI